MSETFKAPSTGAEVDHTFILTLEAAGETVELGKVVVNKAGDATLSFKPDRIFVEAIGFFYDGLRKVAANPGGYDDSDEDND